MNFIYDMRWTKSLGIGKFAREVVSKLPKGEELLDGPRYLDPREPIWLLWHLWKSKAKVFFSPGFIPPLFSLNLVILTIYDTSEIEIKGLSHPIRIAYFMHYVKPLTRRVFKIITTSNYSRERIFHHSNLPLDHIVNVNCGVDTRFSNLGEKSSPGFPYLLYVRAHSLHKNLARLYEAFGNLKRSGHLAKDLKLVVSGKPNDDEGHQLLKCGIWEDFVFAGFIPDEQLPSYYRGAQALALISLYEGFGLPVLEAMACGTPVIASNVTPLPEVARDAALLVNPYEVESIEVGLERVLNDEDLRNSLRVKGLEWALEFDWDRTAARAQVILSDALRYSESRISKKENTV